MQITIKGYETIQLLIITIEVIDGYDIYDMIIPQLVITTK